MTDREESRLARLLDGADNIAMNNEDRHLVNKIIVDEGVEYMSGKECIPRMLDAYRAGMLAGLVRAALKEFANTEAPDKTIEDVIGLFIRTIGKGRGPLDDKEQLEIWGKLNECITPLMTRAYTAGYVRALKDDING